MTTENPFQYGLTNAKSIRALLEIWPNFQQEFEDARQSISKDEHLIYKQKSFGFSWCHLYELPIQEHINQQSELFSIDENLSNIYNQFKSKKDQIAAIPIAIKQIDTHFESLESPSRSEAEELMPMIGIYFGFSISLYNSIKSVLYFGCYLNDLIKKVRVDEDDEALFNAVKIDPTVLGCESVIRRMSKLALLKNDKFFKDLKKALLGKFGRRDEESYQQMRLVIEVLYETNAIKLSDDELYHLFVEILQLYEWDDLDGGNARSLRQYVNTYLNSKMSNI